MVIEIHQVVVPDVLLLLLVVDLDYQRKNRITVSIHPKFDGFGIIVVAPNAECESNTTV